VGLRERRRLAFNCCKLGDGIRTGNWAWRREERFLILERREDSPADGPNSLGVVLGAVGGSWPGLGIEFSLASSICFSSDAGTFGGLNRDVCENPMNPDGLAGSKTVEVC
jgi:hypothetical protein